MRAVLIAVLIFAGIGVLAWATAKPHDGRANTKSLFPKPALDAPLAASKSEETAVVAGGCFWGIQAVFQHLKGVVASTSGYSGGAAKTAHYGDVSTGQTGHAESVKIVFDPSQISYGQILMIFFSVGHNPTELNRQGPDVGSQYRSSIFYADDTQRHIAESYIAQLDKEKRFARPIVTRVDELKGFYPAESYHQDYYLKNPHEPYIMFNDLPKISHLKELFPDYFRDAPVTAGVR